MYTYIYIHIYTNIYIYIYIQIYIYTHLCIQRESQRPHPPPKKQWIDIFFPFKLTTNQMLGFAEVFQECQLCGVGSLVCHVGGGGFTFAQFYAIAPSF